MARAISGIGIGLLPVLLAAVSEARAEPVPIHADSRIIVSESIPAVAEPGGEKPRFGWGKIFPNRPRPLQNRIQNSDRCGCWAHHNLIGCGSFHSECTFIFGSCRTFFGLPCLKGQPPLFGPNPSLPPSMPRTEQPND